MCLKNPNKRLEILDCFNHPWFKNEKLEEEEANKITNKIKFKKLKSIKNDDEDNSYTIKKQKMKRVTEGAIANQRWNSLSDRNLDNKKTFGNVKDQKNNSVYKGKINLK